MKNNKENNKELECINEIISIIVKYDFDFNKVIVKTKIDKIVANKGELWVIKRINGILKNANLENASAKIDALNKFLK